MSAKGFLAGTFTANGNIDVPLAKYSGVNFGVLVVGTIATAGITLNTTLLDGTSAGRYLRIRDDSSIGLIATLSSQIPLFFSLRISTDVLRFTMASATGGEDIDIYIFPSGRL